MRKIFTILVPMVIGILLTASVFAQSPEKMSYQAVIRNSSDFLVTNTQIGMEINIRQGSPSGTIVYTETQTPTTNANGLVSIEFGGGAGFNAIDWSAGHYFIETKTDPTGGTSYTITGTSQLLSVPYALHAKTAETIIGGITETDPLFTAWDKSTGISITESQISDLGNYIETESDPAVAANFDFTGATTGDLLQFNGTKWVKVTPNYLTSYTETQSLADVITINNSANAQIKNVTNPTDAQDAATKAYVDALLARIEALEESDILNNGFTDSRDGTHYNAIKIGNQIWMAENLKYLPSVVGPATGSQTTPYYYVYGYNGTVLADAKATANYSTYGVLYNWVAAMNSETSSTANPSGVQGVCPTGWHLPSDAEWTELTDYLSGTDLAGGKLKATGAIEWGTGLWHNPNIGATNETGFTALPGGFRHTDGVFSFIGSKGNWWSATEVFANTAYFRRMDHFESSVHSSHTTKGFGFSVRCVWD